MDKKYVNHVCIDDECIESYQYESICDEYGKTFSQWNCSCGFLEGKHDKAKLEFIEMSEYEKENEEDFTDFWDYYNWIDAFSQRDY